MPQGVRTTDEDLQQMLNLYKALEKQGMSRMEIYETIGVEFGRSGKAVQMTLLRLRPTTNLALTVVKAHAVKMVRKVIKRGSPSELIDILSRSNIGVLAPKNEGGGQNGGFQLAISADSCGAVKIGLRVGGNQPSLPEGVETTGEENEVTGSPTNSGRQEFRGFLANAQAKSIARLKAAQAKARGEEPLQAPEDEVVEGEVSE